jgi:hypothetical protein
VHTITTDLVILGDISVESADQDHSDHECEEENDEHGVDNREPVDLVGNGMVHGKVHIPSRSPADVALSPLDTVCEDEVAALDLHVLLDGVVVEMLGGGAGGEGRGWVALAIPVH